ncbi:ATP-dependent DNA helicase [Caldimonas tepidiphila]|uniref:ATP-dependent DNA helicase n=1 Tax=Caldimonas tepidiphila TaxID=2315841 RepID=UPI000E5C33E3|nr:AAA family ATPase [Caldimonas tepidiphila]
MALTPSQQQALSAIQEFLASDAHCFLLKGSAGTGKTRLLAALARRLRADRRLFALLAPTGRAARILSARTDEPAGTLHRHLYALDQIRVFEEAQARNDPGIRFIFPLKGDDPADMVFIVDESSMVGDKETEADVYQFGSGRLLADLIEFARLGRPGHEDAPSAKLIFVGDPAQLPPVGDNRSPALSAAYLHRTFGLDCREFELTEVLRQSSGSAVLDRAKALRDALLRQDFNRFQLAEAPGEIRHAGVRDALDHVIEAQHAGTSSVLITGTNARALDLNRAVRARLWGREDLPVQIGELLLINKNNPGAGLMNGDLVRVRRVDETPQVRHVPLRGVPQPVRLSFRAVGLAYRDPRGRILETGALILENLLESRDRETTPLELRALLVDFRQRHPGLRPGSTEFRLAIQDDPYFNALQVKYGYALTCHKAQGGEWGSVVVNFNDAAGDKRNESFFRWAYTAITRSRGRLLLIDPPSFGPFSGIRFDVPAATAHPAPSPAEPARTEAAAGECADADWDRFSFSPGQEALFRHHGRIREALSGLGVGIARLQHGQYFERYWLTRGHVTAAVQYRYKGDLRVSGVVPAPGTNSDPTLLQDCLARLTAVLLSPQDAGPARPQPPFRQDFEALLRQAVTDSGLRVVAVEHDTHRLRFTFEDEARRGRIDFFHDDKHRWTRAIEVGKPGSSQGIYQQVVDILGMTA